MGATKSPNRLDEPPGAPKPMQQVSRGPWAASRWWLSGLAPHLPKWVTEMVRFGPRFFREELRRPWYIRPLTDR